MNVGRPGSVIGMAGGEADTLTNLNLSQYPTTGHQELYTLA